MQAAVESLRREDGDDSICEKLRAGNLLLARSRT